MTVELVSMGTSESRVLKNLPAVIREESGVSCEDSQQGNNHCLVSRIDNQLVVWDLGTRGGTFVNGTRVTRATLKAGDTLRLGGTDFSVKCDRHPQRYLYGLRC